MHCYIPKGSDYARLQAIWVALCRLYMHKGLAICMVALPCRPCANGLRIGNAAGMLAATEEQRISQVRGAALDSLAEVLRSTQVRFCFWKVSHLRVMYHYSTYSCTASLVRLFSKLQANKVGSAVQTQRVCYRQVKGRLTCAWPSQGGSSLQQDTVERIRLRLEGLVSAEKNASLQSQACTVKDSLPPAPMAVD